MNYLGAYQNGALFVQPAIESLRNELIEIEGATTAINYGLYKARFPVAVKSDSRIRMTGKIVNVEDMPNNGIKLFVECTIQIEGEEKPAYVGELLTALY